MFLHLLTDDQQRAVLALAREFIEADSHLADEEQNILELMYAEAGLDFEEALPTVPRNVLCSQFESRQSRAALLLELIGIGHADNEFSAGESEFVHGVARSLDISEDEVRKMDGWVRRQIDLATEAEEFWRD